MAEMAIDRRDARYAAQEAARLVHAVSRVAVVAEVADLNDEHAVLARRRSQGLSVAESDDALDFVGLEAERHRSGRAAEQGHIVEFADHSLEPDPVGDVAGPQIDHGEAAACFGARRLSSSSRARPPNVLSCRGIDSPTTA